MQRILTWKFRRTTLLTLLYGAFVGGVGIAGEGYYFNATWLAAPVALLLIFYRRSVMTACLVLCLGLGLGLCRGSFFAEKLTAYYPLYGQEVTFTARAAEDGIYGKKSQLTFTASHIIAQDDTELPGKVSVSGFGVNSIYQGDEVQITGKLRPGFSVYQGSMSYAQITLVEHHPSWVASVRRHFAAGMQSALPEPLASFAMGLLIGQRATLPDTVKQELLMVGLTHIIAVSGYNLTIILQACGGVFGKASKRLGTALAAALIFVFVMLAGSSASIIRAAIVSMLSIVAGYYGRTFKPLNLILFAAAITAWVNPIYVWSDASWYLSFLAFYGVMILAPALSQRLRPNKQLALPLAVGLESICAEAMTLPYVLHVFGQMSLIGLPANILVVTMVPLAMLLSAFAGLAGMFMAPIAGWIALPARLLLDYMLEVAHALSSVPHIFIQNVGFSTAQMLGAYSCVLFVSLVLGYKTKSKNGTITDKKYTNPKEQILERTFQMVND